MLVELFTFFCNCCGLCDCCDLNTVDCDNDVDASFTKFCSGSLVSGNLIFSIFILSLICDSTFDD